MRRSLSLILLSALASCGTPASRPAPDSPAIVNIPITPTPTASSSAAFVSESTGDAEDTEPAALQLADGLRIEEITIGAGREVQQDSRVVVHYVGSFEDGTEFDSSRKRGQPAEFPLGRGMLIKGFEEGLVGMRVGGRRRVIVPPDLGYGERGRPPTIPPHTDLVFDIEVLEVK